jgi:hypothetical protein
LIASQRKNGSSQKWKFPNERTYASNQAKCLCVSGVENVSIGIYQIAQSRKYHHDAQNFGKVARLENQISKHGQMKAEKHLPLATTRVGGFGIALLGLSYLVGGFEGPAVESPLLTRVEAYSALAGILVVLGALVWQARG